MIHINNNENETENNLDNLDKVIEKWSNITSPATMEDFVNKEHDYNNQNGTDAKINNMNEGERTWSDVTPPAMMV